MSSDTATEPRRDGRDESRAEQLDRNTVELLNELRVAGTGIQVIFAFLLVVPFNSGWSRLSSFDRDVYFIALLSIAVAAVLLIAPSIHHRLLFRQAQKAYLVSVGNQLTIVAMGFLTVGVTGILELISDVVFGGVAAAVVGLLAAAVVVGLWFAEPPPASVAGRGDRRPDREQRSGRGQLKRARAAQKELIQPNRGSLRRRASASIPV